MYSQLSQLSPYWCGYLSAFIIVIFLLILRYYEIKEYESNEFKKLQAKIESEKHNNEEIKIPKLFSMPNVQNVVSIMHRDICSITYDKKLILTEENEKHVIAYAYPLPSFVLQRELFIACELGLESNAGKRIRRGLTIGSAIYNYNIPAKFMLLDEETAYEHDLFIGRAETKSALEWETLIIENGNVLGRTVVDEEKEKEFGISTESIKYASDYFVPTAASLLLTLSKELVLPDIHRVIYTLSHNPRVVWRHLGKMSNMKHLFHCTIYAVAKVLGINIPVWYVVMSPITDKIYNKILDRTEVKKPILNIVVNNK